MTVRGLLASAALGTEVGQCRERRIGCITRGERQRGRDGETETDREKMRQRNREKKVDWVWREKEVSRTSKNQGKGWENGGLLASLPLL